MMPWPTSRLCCRPREFTNRGHNHELGGMLGPRAGRASRGASMGASSRDASSRSTWGTAEERAEISRAFDVIHARFGARRLYLGEFGTNADRERQHGRTPRAGANESLTSSLAWLHAVLAEASRHRGYPTALWTYYGGPKALVHAAGPEGRMCQWRRSPIAEAVFRGHDRAGTRQRRLALGRASAFARRATRGTDRSARECASRQPVDRGRPETRFCTREHASLRVLRCGMWWCEK